MARFNTYSQLVSQNSYSSGSKDDDDENEEFEDAVTDEQHHQYGQDRYNFNAMATEFDDEEDNDADSAPMKANELTQVKPEPRFELEVPKPSELVVEFTDSSYWRP